MQNNLDIACVVLPDFKQKYNFIVTYFITVTLAVLLL